MLGALLHPEGDAGVRAVRNTEELREQTAGERAPLARFGVPSLVREHDAALATLEEYSAAAERIVRLAGRDAAAAQALLPAFEEEFVQTRDQMAVVTDQLRAETDAVRTELVTRAAAQHWRTGAVVGIALALLAALALGIRRSIRAALAAKRSVEDEVRRANLQLRGDADDKRFQSTLKGAFDMALGEGEAGEVVRRAARELVPDRHVELLMADNSRAHLSAVMVEPVGAAAGCSVSSPGDCVAVRRGRPLRFGNPDELSSCPRLRGRGTPVGSAVCAPVTFLGEGLGVLHVVSPDADLGNADEDGLRHLAEEAGSRIGTLRAFNRQSAPGEHGRSHRPAQPPHRRGAGP
ncbi:MAG: GAF domain-containing protein [Actinomycetota bacterium]|nr:GAF domain-containing protein [Actinomycetota bacterium]